MKRVKSLYSSGNCIDRVDPTGKSSTSSSYYLVFGFAHFESRTGVLVTYRDVAGPHEPR